GGPEARDIAQRYWSNPTPEARAIYLERCHPLYNVRPRDDTDAKARRIVNNAVNIHFSKVGGDFKTMDFRPALRDVRCPTLVMAGERDPIIPITLAEEVVAALPPHLVRFERFANCGHGVHWDNPDRTFRLIREFIAA